jgi:hypothetical protein
MISRPPPRAHHRRARRSGTLAHRSDEILVGPTESAAASRPTTSPTVLETRILDTVHARSALAAALAVVDLAL